jgi:hypothetical protein
LDLTKDPSLRREQRKAPPIVEPKAKILPHDRNMPRANPFGNGRDFEHILSSFEKFYLEVWKPKESGIKERPFP